MTADIPEILASPDGWATLQHPHSIPDLPQGLDGYLPSIPFLFGDSGILADRVQGAFQHHKSPSDTFVMSPNVSIPPIFGDADSPALSDPDNGIRRQGIALNLTEIVRSISERVPLMVISNSLALYHAPCWKLLSKNQAIRAIQEITYKLYPQDASYISRRQFEDIYQSLLYSPTLPSLDVIPAPDDQVLCCQDCMVDLRTGERYPHHPKDLRFSFLNLKSSDIGQGSGKHFESYMATVTNGNKALKRRVLEMIGVILTGTPVKNFFYLWGVSGSGKTQLAKFLEELLGWENCYSTSGINALSERWTTGMLVGKLLCTCGDVSNRLLNEETISRIKQISGQDRINGERKHMDPFTYECVAKLLLVGNFPLQVSSSQRESALMDRLIEIYFPEAIPREEQEPNFYKTLLKEAGYIVGLSLEALAELKNRRYVFTTVELPSQAFAPQQQSLEDFIFECCEFDCDAITPTSELYHKFCSLYPADCPPTYSLAQFGYQLSQQYPELQSVRSNKMRGYRGIRLCQPDE